MVNVLGPKVGYIDLMDTATLEKVAQPTTRRWNPLRPSAAGYCGRKLAYDFHEYRGNATYEKEHRNADTLRLLDLGNPIEKHVLWQFKDLKSAEVKYTQQVVTFFRLAPDLLIEGSLDLTLISEEYRAIGDVKSKKDKFSSWSKTNWDETTQKLMNMKSVHAVNERVFWVEDLPAFLEELNDPFFSDNFVQLNGYANTDFCKERNIDNAFILQYNKNDSRLREIRFKPSTEVYEKVRAKFTAVQQAVDVHKDPTLVPKEYTLGSIRCAFCARNTECWGPAADAQQEYFDTFPSKKWPKDTSYLSNELETQLEEAYTDYKAASESAKETEAIEAHICALLDENKISKVKFADGVIYELKLLKSPRPHFELRISK